MSFRPAGVAVVIAAALTFVPGALSIPDDALDAGAARADAHDTSEWTDWLHPGAGASVPAPTVYEIPANGTPVGWPFDVGWLTGQGMLRSVGTTIYQQSGGGVRGQVLLRGSDPWSGDEGLALRLDFDPVLEPVEGYRPIYTAMFGLHLTGHAIMARATGVDSASGPSSIAVEILSVANGQIDDTLASEVTAFDTSEGMVLAAVSGGTAVFLVVDGELEEVAFAGENNGGEWIGVGIETQAGHELDHGISGISVNHTSEWFEPERVTVTDGDPGLATLHRDYAYSDWLRAHDFGFAAEIPPGATILGVEVRSTQRTEGSTAEQLSVDSVRLWPDDGPDGEDRSTGAYWSDPADETEPVVYSYGGSSDLWGLSLTRADVIAQDFGWVQRGLLDSANGSLLVDSMEMRVRYEPE